MLGTVKFHVVCLRPQTSHKHTLTSMHTTGPALAANLHHPTCVQKLARQKFRVSSHETIEKKFRFWGLTPKPEAVATDSMGGGL